MPSLHLARTLPRPGPVWGSYPLRPGNDLAPPWRLPHWRGPLAFCCAVARNSQRQAQGWRALDAAARPAALQALRATLQRRGLQPDVLARALGWVAACAGETLQQTPRETQLVAAAALLDNHMAEMATGEGKTLAIGLAAAVAALAGMPVHVVTANDYLAGRDAHTMSPLFEALGLRAATLAGAAGDEARRAVYAHAIVYATAKDLAFDFLRDRQALDPRKALEHAAQNLGRRAPVMPVMRGLCMALLDEADSILLDEAELPLVLSRNVAHAARRAFLWQALALARQLDAPADFRVHLEERNAELTAAGERRLEALALPLGGAWSRPRYRREAVATALAGLHACLRNTHYVVRDGAIELLDQVTGRVAQGRVWSRGLHTVVALKEGLGPPPETETVAQTTFQRFFQRYWRLCGTSGTLLEARSELHAVYGADTVRIPLHRPSRRRVLPARRFEDADTLFAAAALRVAGLQAQGRPVLVATDDVDASLRLSQRLHERGVSHRVLNALQDAQEARTIAQAGQSGQVTVATRMAGRGTDIEPDAAALAAGGLHVLSCQHNPSRRLDRQLAGRAARHGDPGSVEHWSRADFAGPGAPPLFLPLPLCNGLAAFWVTAWLAGAGKGWAQWRDEQRRAVVRHALLEQDLHWEGRLSFSGLAK